MWLMLQAERGGVFEVLEKAYLKLWAVDLYSSRATEGGALFVGQNAMVELVGSSPCVTTVTAAPTCSKVLPRSQSPYRSSVACT